MIKKIPDVNKAEVDRSLELLCKLRILEQDKQGKFHAVAAVATPRDFLAVNIQKTARVSFEGHRRVSLRGLLMALREGVTERKCGSFVWREEMPAPKHRLLTPRLLDPVNGNHTGSLTFEVEKRKKNDMIFKLKFTPPLLPGQTIQYGFYIWNENHYSRSRNEAVARYKDEWIREGLAILDPPLQFRITVELPESYEYQKAIVEKDPVLTMDGPNQPGEELSRFDSPGRILDFSMSQPTPGHYFVSWIPPDQ